MRFRIAITAGTLVVALMASPTQAAAGTGAGAAERRSDFNGDGHHDLAVGVELEDVGSADDAGAVQVIYGTDDGLNGDAPIDDQFITQGTLGSAIEEDDGFGRVLAAGAVLVPVPAPVAGAV